MPSPNYDPEQWARYVLTGNPDASAPNDAALALPVVSATNRLYALYPCVGSDPLASLSSQGDVNAASEVIGRWAAAEYLGTPAGQALSGVTGGASRVKSGRVEVSTTTSGVSAESLQTSANVPLLRISCIRSIAAADAAAESPGVILSGTRRRIGEPTSVEGVLLVGRPGEGSDCY